MSKLRQNDILWHDSMVRVLLILVLTLSSTRRADCAPESGESPATQARQVFERLREGPREHSEEGSSHHASRDFDGTDSRQTVAIGHGNLANQDKGTHTASQNPKKIYSIKAPSAGRPAAVFSAEANKAAKADPPPTDHVSKMYMFAGGILGALVGAMFGPIGILVGFLAGAVIGGLTAKATGSEKAK